MKKKNLLLLLSMSAFLVGCNDTPIVPDTSDTEIIELDNDEEKRIAFELFSHVYKNIQK